MHPGGRGAALPIAAPEVGDVEPAVLGRRNEKARRARRERLRECADDHFRQLLARFENSAERAELRLRVEQRSALHRARDDRVELATLAGAAHGGESAFVQTANRGGAFARQREDDHLGARARLLDSVQQSQIGREQHDVPAFCLGEPLRQRAGVGDVHEAVASALQLRAFAHATDNQDPARHELPARGLVASARGSNRRAAVRQPGRMSKPTRVCAAASVGVAARWWAKNARIAQASAREAHESAQGDCSAAATTPSAHRISQWPTPCSPLSGGLRSARRGWVTV